MTGKEQWRCPRRPILEDPIWFGDIIHAYQGYSKGYLPHAGGLNDQPALYPSLMAIVDRAVNECHDTKREREAKKRK